MHSQFPYFITALASKNEVHLFVTGHGQWSGFVLPKGLPCQHTALAQVGNVFQLYTSAAVLKAREEHESHPNTA